MCHKRCGLWMNVACAIGPSCLPQLLLDRRACRDQIMNGPHLLESNPLLFHVYTNGPGVCLNLISFTRQASRQSPKVQAVFRWTGDCNPIKQLLDAKVWRHSRATAPHHSFIVYHALSPSQPIYRLALYTASSPYPLENSNPVSFLINFFHDLVWYLLFIPKLNAA